jgi:hypothetical protein
VGSKETAARHSAAVLELKDRHLPKRVANMLNVKEQTLANWRFRGDTVAAMAALLNASDCVLASEVALSRGATTNCQRYCRTRKLYEVSR